MNELRPKLAHIPGISAYRDDAAGDPDRRTRQSKGQYQFTMQASDATMLYPAAQKLIDAASTSTRVADVTSDMQNNSPQVNVDIDRAGPRPSASRRTWSRARFTTRMAPGRCRRSTHRATNTR